ncbi:MAG: TetR/AcrR family transcriptional regulator [Calditrichota bacterium]
MTPKEKTRRRILKTAGKMLLANGYNGFSYRDIAEEVGIRKASIHYHFPSKAELGAAIVRNYHEWLIRWAEEMDTKHDTCFARLDAFFKLYRDFFGVGEKICMNGVLSANLNGLPEEMKEEFRKLLRFEHAWMKRVIKEGQESGEFKSDQSPGKLALLIGAAMQGAIQIARANDRMDLLDVSIDQMKIVLTG